MILPRTNFPLASLCVMLLVSGCHHPAVKHMQQFAEKMQEHAQAASTHSIASVSKLAVADVSPAAVIGTSDNNQTPLDLGNGMHARIEKRYISLTGEPCVLAQLGTYESDEAQKDDGYFAPESRKLSCQRNNKWSFYPYFGDSLNEESL